MEPKVLVQHDGRGVVRLLLNRPTVRNAMDPDLIGQTSKALSDLSRDSSVRMIVLQGAGKDFCAGADLAWMREISGMTPEAVVEDSRPLQALYCQLSDLSVPLIGFVHGNAMAGGLGILAACDCVIALSDARFAVSEVRLGLIPALLAPFLVRKIGPSMLQYLALTGETVNATAMQRAGLVHLVAADDHDATRILAEITSSILRASPDAIGMCKKMLRDMHLAPFEAALPVALQWVADSRRASCAHEGLTAFLDRRAPLWDAT